MYQIPSALQPGKHRVHSAYIWLDGLRVVFTIFIATAVSVAGSIVPAFVEDADMPLSAVPWVIGLSALFMVVVAAIVFVIQWLSWKHLSYELTQGEFNLYSGILSKKRIHVPYQRVQSVNQSAGVLQRLLGLCSVKIDTAGGADNEAVTLKCIRNSDAEALRSELFRRKKVLLAGGTVDEYGNVFVNGTVIPSAWTIACFGGDVYAAFVSLGVSPDQAAAAVSAGYDPNLAVIPAQSGESNVLDKADEVLQDVRGIFGGQEVATGTVSYEAGLSNKELVFAGVSGAADAIGVLAAAVIAIAAAAAPLFEDAMFAWIEGSVEAAIVGVDPQAATAFVNSALLSAALMAAGTLLVLWLLSVLGTVVRFGGFKARRRESRIEVEHGLLKRTFHGVDVDRVQSVIVKQGFIRRLMGYCELSVGKIESLGEKGENSIATGGVILHPFVKTDRVPQILAGLLPEFADVPQETVKPAPVALRRAIVRKALIRSAAFWLFAIALIVQLCLKGAMDAGLLPMGHAGYQMLQSVLFAYDAFFVVIAAVHVADALLWHRFSGMGYNRNFMSVTNAGLSSETVVFPRKKIQFAYLQANPFQRRARVKIVAAVTAAGVGGTTEHLWDVAEEQADAWMEWVRPRGV